MTEQISKQTASDSSDTIAMIIEIVFGLFGILGMGWLYVKNVPIAIAAFIGFAILFFIEFAILAGTLGFALCVVVPFNLVVAVISGFRVRDYVRNTGAVGSVPHLVIGIAVGFAVICGGITLFFGGLAALGSTVQ